VLAERILVAAAGEHGHENSGQDDQWGMLDGDLSARDNICG
jgi:hypothetical protein